MACAMRDLPMPGSPDISTTEPSPALGLVPAAHQQFDFLLPADQRHGGRAQGLEAALGGARAQHLPCRQVLSKALESDGSKIAIFEEAAGQPVGARCDHHGARFGQRLEARGQIWSSHRRPPAPEPHPRQ